MIVVFQYADASFEFDSKLRKPVENLIVNAVQNQGCQVTVAEVLKIAKSPKDIKKVQYFVDVLNRAKTLPPSSHKLEVLVNFANEDADGYVLQVNVISQEAMQSGGVWYKLCSLHDLGDY